MNSLPAGGAVGAGELEVSPVTLYTKQSSAQKRCFIRHYLQDEMKFSPPVNESNFSRRDYLCDVTNTEKQLCSPHESFVVVLEKG